MLLRLIRAVVAKLAVFNTCDFVCTELFFIAWFFSVPGQFLNL